MERFNWPVPDSQDDRTHGLSDFVLRRWADARSHLQQIDPGYIGAVDALKKLNAQGVVSSRPQPKHLLPRRWLQTIQGGTDLLWQIEQIWCAVDELNPTKYENLDEHKRGRIAIYHVVNWLHHTHGLVEKAQLLVARMCSAYLKSETSKTRHRIENTYKDRLRSEAGRRISRIRNPVAHGGEGSVVYRIDRDLWEPAVAVGLTPEMFLAETEKTVSPMIERWYRERVKQTNGLIAAVSAILLELETSVTVSEQPDTE